MDHASSRPCGPAKDDNLLRPLDPPSLPQRRFHRPDPARLRKMALLRATEAALDAAKPPENVYVHPYTGQRWVQDSPATYDVAHREPVRRAPPPPAALRGPPGFAESGLSMAEFVLQHHGNTNAINYFGEPAPSGPRYVGGWDHTTEDLPAFPPSTHLSGPFPPQAFGGAIGIAPVDDGLEPHPVGHVHQAGRPVVMSPMPPGYRPMPFSGPLMPSNGYKTPPGGPFLPPAEVSMHSGRPRTPQSDPRDAPVARPQAFNHQKKAFKVPEKAFRSSINGPKQLEKAFGRSEKASVETGNAWSHINHAPSSTGQGPPSTNQRLSFPSQGLTQSPYFTTPDSDETSPDSRDVSKWQDELGSDSDWSDDEDEYGASFTEARSSSRSGSLASSSAAPARIPQHYDTLCAISESRDGKVIGLATICITVQQVDITRIINDNKYERLIDTLGSLAEAPQCFLLLKSVVSKGSKSLLAPTIKREYPMTPIIPYERKYWNELEGLNMIDRFALCHEAKALRARLNNHFYVSCALAAVMNYVQDEMKIFFTRSSVRIRYMEPAGAMGLDRSTVESLELLQNNRRTASKKGTLFKVLDSTLTPQGRRLLRSSLLQPRTDPKVISDRHDAMEELIANEDLSPELIKRLKALLRIDAERLATWMLNPMPQAREPLERGVVRSGGLHQLLLASHEDLYASESELSKILMLKQYLSGIQEIHGVLASAECRSNLCDWVCQSCSPESLSPMQAIIEQRINQDAAYSKTPIDTRNNRLWAVKAEPNSVLERARGAFKDRVNELNEYADSLNEAFNEKLGNTAKLYLDSGRNYYLRFHWTDVERELIRSHSTSKQQNQKNSLNHRQSSASIAGVDIINGTRNKQYYHCQTVELIQRSAEIQLQADIVTIQSDKVVVELKTALAEHAEQLFCVSEAISVLDMICAFVQASTIQNYVRPTMGTKTLVLRDARHPAIEIRKTNFVPNNVYSGIKGSRFQVVTGGNMSGKSTFIRSIAMIQILAQMGCFVPASYASMPICDRLFTRLSTDDKPERNLGTWGVELTEMNMILRYATKDSLVIIDELGRGTSPKEGLAYAIAMSEMLIRSGARVYFSTHFTKLARLLNRSSPSSVTNVHLTGDSTKIGEIHQISLPHKLTNGPVPNEDYGIDLARRYLPPRLIRNAEIITQYLRQIDPSKKFGRVTREFKLDKLQLGLSEILKQAQSSSMDDAALASFLAKLQIEYHDRLKEIECEHDGEDVADEESSAAQRVPKPILEKPGEDELKEMKERGKREEKRVMAKNNKRREKQIRHNETKRRTRNNKRKHRDWDKHNLEVKKKAMIVNQWLYSVSDQPVPINRGRLIEEQRIASLTQSNTSRSLPNTSFHTSNGSPVPPEPSQTNLDVSSPSAEPSSPQTNASGPQADAFGPLPPPSPAPRHASLPESEASLPRIIPSSHPSDAGMPSLNASPADTQGANQHQNAAENNTTGTDASKTDQTECPLAQWHPLRDWYAYLDQEAAGDENA